MTLKRDSLLFRIITYNGIAIIFVSTIMSLLFGLITVNEINNRLLDKSREKVTILGKAYISFVEKSEKDLFNSITNALNLMALDDEEKDSQRKMAEIIRSQLNIESYTKYNNSFIQVISDKRKVLSESGSRDIKYDIIGNTELVPYIPTLENKDYYFVGTNNELYVRIIEQYRTSKSFEKSYIILTLPLSNYSLERVRNYTNIKKEDKIFLLAKNNYIYGELGVEKKDNFLKRAKFSKKGESLVTQEYYFLEKELNDEPHYLALNNLKDENENTIGSVGIAISKKSFLAIKYMLATMILAISLISVIISITLCARIFTKLLHPLSILTDRTKGRTQNENELEEEQVYEIRAIANFLRSMGRKNKMNEELLKIKNENLKTNLNRIVAVENILMGVDIDKNFTESITKILRALTSEVGLGYSRAMYFEYDEEVNRLSAKDLSINSNILSNIDEYTQGIGGFAFQIKDLGNLLPLLKIKYEPGNLFWESMHKGEIIYHNEKGYKFNFGNELFKSLGFSNFLILPISDKDMKLGCILVDYFGKKKKVSAEEVEVLTLLLMNLVIRVKNDIQEEKKLTNERVYTMTKISNKFLDENEKLLDKMETFIEKIISKEYNSKDIDKINKCVIERKRQNSIMKEVFDNSERNFKVVNLEKLLTRIIKDHENIIKKSGINMSLFTNYSGYIYADKKKLYQMFVEIIKNSIEAILARNKLDKKINLVLSSASNNRVIVEIIDNGIGMEQVELSRLKKPYSQEKGNILGLGLTTIYSIVREHKALITITSEVDEGTKVRIIFNEYREDSNL